MNINIPHGASLQDVERVKLEVHGKIKQCVAISVTALVINIIATAFCIWGLYGS